MVTPARNSLQALQTALTATEAILPQVTSAGAGLVQALRAGNKVLTCGNGGSATDALHLAEELTGRFEADRRPLPAVCLAADLSALTCIANDYGFEAIFARQVTALGQAGDVLVAFSTSGTSENVLRALQAAKGAGLFTVLVTGKTGGPWRDQADHALVVPSHVTARIQEIHTLILHLWLEQIEREDWS